jgi:parvulin-like peptidyl-prolyl isomerase
MKRSLAMLAAAAAALGLVAAGCGGSGDVPSGSVAVVDGTEIQSTELDALMAQAKGSYAAQKQDFPKVGTPEYQSIQQQYVAFLVQKAEFEHEAEELGLEITDSDVQKQRQKLIDDRFEGDGKKLAQALEAQGLSEAAFQETLRVAVLSDKIFQAVTKDVKVTDSEALQAFTENREQYGARPDSRETRHILIAEKNANGQIDFPKSKAEADRIYGLLRNGGDFAALAKQHSADEASAASGGKYTAKRGQSVPEFDAAAFELKTNEISRPVKTQFGYHLIQPTSDIRPGTTFEKLEASIKATLLQARKSETMTKWVEELQDEYDGKVSYATGYAPPELPDTTQTETE